MLSEVRWALVSDAPSRSAVSRLLLALRRASRPTPLMALVASFSLAACLGLVLYAATSLTFLASEPMADPRFGPQNACALKGLKNARSGFAVGTDGAVALFSDSQIVLCEAGKNPAPKAFELAGVQSAALDFNGHLWVSQSADGDARLLKLAPGQDHFEDQGELKGDLVGTASGVVALDEDARLLSVADDGRVLAVVQLPRKNIFDPEHRPRLTANEDGTLVAVVAYSGVFVFDANTLEKLRAESPCNVEWAWWLKGRDELLLSCGPNASWSLKLNARTGEKEEARLPIGRPSVRIPGMDTYVEDCGALPCSTSPPG